MTDDETVARGHLAARLLADEGLMSFFNELLSGIKTSSFTTTALETTERERLYFQHKGIEDVLGIMNYYKAKAEDIIEFEQRSLNNFDVD